MVRRFSAADATLSLRAPKVAAVAGRAPLRAPEAWARRSAASSHARRCAGVAASMVLSWAHSTPAHDASHLSEVSPVRSASGFTSTPSTGGSPRAFRHPPGPAAILSFASRPGRNSTFGSESPIGATRPPPATSCRKTPSGDGPPPCRTRPSSPPGRFFVAGSGISQREHIRRIRGRYRPAANTSSSKNIPRSEHRTSPPARVAISHGGGKR